MSNSFRYQVLAQLGLPREKQDCTFLQGRRDVTPVWLMGRPVLESHLLIFKGPFSSDTQFNFYIHKELHAEGSARTR